MLKLLLPNGQEVTIENPLDQVFSTETDAGVQYHWNVTQGIRLAQKRGIVHIVSLSQMGVTIESIREQYDGMNELYALSTDLSLPIAFVPLEGKDKLVDGWHRLFKAAVMGIDELPAYILTQEEADSCLICKLAPEQGIDWGQKTKHAARPLSVPVPEGKEAENGT